MAQERLKLPQTTADTSLNMQATQREDEKSTLIP